MNDFGSLSSFFSGWGPPPGRKTVFPRGRERTNPETADNKCARSLIRVNAACARRGAPHEPRWSVVSTVRQLNEPKISHFDQLGCSRIGRKTARKSSTVK